MSKFARHTVAAMGGEIVVFCGSLLLGMITARTLGPYGKGVIGVVVGAYTILVTVLSLRFERAVTYYTAKNPEATSKTVGAAIAVGLITAICAFPVLALLPEGARFYLFGGVPAEFVTAGALNFINIYFTLIIGGILAGQHRFDSRLIFMGFFYTQKVVVAFAALVLFQLALKEYIIVSSLVDLTLCLSYLIYLYKANSWSLQLDRRHMTAMIRYASAGFMGIPAELVLTSLCLFVLSSIHGSHDAGLFVVSIMLANTIGYLADAMKVVILPSAASNGNLDESKVRRMLLLIELVMTAGLVLFGRWLLVFFFGAQFEGSFWPAVLLVPGVIGTTYRSVLSASIWGRGEPGKAAIAPVVGAVVSAVGAFVLIPRYGILGAACAMSIANIAGAIITIVIFVRLTGTPTRSLFFVSFGELRGLLELAKARVRAGRVGRDQLSESETQSIPSKSNIFPEV